MASSHVQWHHHHGHLSGQIWLGCHHIPNGCAFLLGKSPIWGTNSRKFEVSYRVTRNWITKNSLVFGRFSQTQEVQKNWILIIWDIHWFFGIFRQVLVYEPNVSKPSEFTEETLFKINHDFGILKNGKLQKRGKMNLIGRLQLSTEKARKEENESIMQLRILRTQEAIIKILKMRKVKFITFVFDIFHTIRKVKFLSKNLILTKPQYFHEFFTQIFFLQFFSWNQSCQQIKSPKPQHFHEFFTPKKIDNHRNQSWIFGQKMKISNSVKNQARGNRKTLFLTLEL